MFQILLPISLIAWLIFRSTKATKEGLKMRRLSENFTLGELIHTDTGLENIPTQKEISALQNLVDQFLQPLRNYYGKPIFITSGFRSKVVNDFVGGSSRSQHMLGEAADFVIPNVSNEQIIRDVKKLGLPYDQIIDEQLYNSSGQKRNWIHVSLNTRTAQRGQHLAARNSLFDKKTRYELV